MRPLLGVAAAILAVAAQPAMAAHPLCSIIRKLEASAPVKVDGPQKRRFIEFHWGFDQSPDSVWSWGCQHSADPTAGATCDWLMERTSREFAMRLPQGIMACYGYRFPASASYDWGNLAGRIILHGSAGRRLLLDLNYRDLPEGEVAMRLAVEADGMVYQPAELPPIKSLPVVQDKAGE